MGNSSFSSEWDEFVKSRPEASVFQLYGWKEVAEKGFGHRAHYLSRRKSGALSAVFPLIEVKSPLFGHSLVSTGFTVGGGPLADDEAELHEMVEEAKALSQKLGVSYLELRDVCGDFEGFMKRDDLYADFKGPIAQKEEDNLLQIPRKQRAVIRKALNSELTVTIDRDAKDFFALYSRTMRDHGTPALPRHHFERLLKLFGEACEILTVRHDGRPISSVLSFYFSGVVLPYYTGSSHEARSLGSNDMMYWSVMRRAIELGMREFDFGRSKVGTGPYAFKHNWGFKARPITHQFHLVKAQGLPNLNPTNPRYRLMIEAWRRLPLPVANFISPFLSKDLA